MFLKRTIKIMVNLILLAILCTGQVAAAPNVGQVENKPQGPMPQQADAPGATIRVSVSSAGVEGNGGGSERHSISANGRYIAFASYSTNLVSGDTNSSQDVFVRDTLTNTTTRVSVASNGVEGNNSSDWPSISPDGRYVAFVSAASNLVSGGEGGIFVRDTVANITELVSIGPDGVPIGGVCPSISADGRYIAFANGGGILLRDTHMNTLKLVSVNSDGVEGDLGSGCPSISADGRFIAFDSYATNLVSGDTNSSQDVFVRDTLANTTSRVSVDSNGAQGYGDSIHSSISADGLYVAFYSIASNLVSGDTNGTWDVFVRDTLMNITTRISIDSNGTLGNGFFNWPSISSDGRYVAFESFASNLVGNNTNSTWDVFVRDTLTNTTTRVSVDSNGMQGNGWSQFPSISSDGHYVAYTSDASNLVSGDTNGVPDVFVHEMNITPPSDKTPVVFVHGWLGASLPPADCLSNHQKYEQPIPEADAIGYFQGVGDQLKTDNGNIDVFYAQLVTSSCYTPSLEENVPNLMAAIDKAKAVTGKSKVILIAHSMGGLVARAYIEGPYYRGDVETLFTFGSPHLGTPEDAISFLLNGISFGNSCKTYQAAVCDFSVLGMRLFNIGHHRNTEVNYHLVSGDTPYDSRNASGKAMDWLIGTPWTPDDAAVPTTSGTGLAGSIDRLITNELHGPGTNFGPHTYFIKNNDANNSYDLCIKKVLVENEANCGTVSQTNASAIQSVSDSSSQHSVFENGTLFYGQNVIKSVSVEGGETLFAAQWQNGTLAFTLTDPNSQIIDATYATNHPDIVTYTEDANGAVYSFPNAIPGNWQMLLQSVNVPSEGASFITFAAFNSTVTLTGITDKQWYAPGTSASVTATLSGSPSSATITANVIRADGVSDPLTFSSIGNGQYQATYSMPNVPGYAEVQFAVSGITADSQPFERGTNLVFQISPETFALNHTYADNPVPYSGLSAYQFLDVAVGIDAAIDGKVGLSADLVDGSGNFVAHTLAIQDVTAGAPTLTLRFDGTDIFASQHDGPYTLTNILLTDESGATLVTQQAQAVYTTASYLYTDFAPNQIYLPLVQR